MKRVKVVTAVVVRVIAVTVAFYNLSSPLPFHNVSISSGTSNNIRNGRTHVNGLPWIFSY